jgi:hypothetical protein
VISSVLNVLSFDGSLLSISSLFCIVRGLI